MVAGILVLFFCLLLFSSQSLLVSSISSNLVWFQIIALYTLDRRRLWPKPDNMIFFRVKFLESSHKYYKYFWILGHKFSKSYYLALIKVRPWKTVTFGEIRTCRWLWFKPDNMILDFFSWQMSNCDPFDFALKYFWIVRFLKSNYLAKIKERRL